MEGQRKERGRMVGQRKERGRMEGQRNEKGRMEGQRIERGRMEGQRIEKWDRGMQTSQPQKVSRAYFYSHGLQLAVTDLP